jgi:hypothetical protein
MVAYTKASGGRAKSMEKDLRVCQMETLIKEIITWVNLMARVFTNGPMDKYLKASFSKEKYYLIIKMNQYKQPMIRICIRTINLTSYFAVR